MLKRPLTALAVLCVFAIPAQAQVCKASFYGAGEHLSRYTASGERFNPNALVAAHRFLAFGTRLRVSWRGRSVVVRVVDRGPAQRTGRCLDLSFAAARVIGLVAMGVATVRIEVVG